MAPCSGEDASLPSIGDRVVEDTGFRSTVRYVGAVCTAKDKTSVWIGVEFDDPARGKHDGAVEKSDGSILRYFSCTNGGSGSFLKPGKISRGVSMAEALRNHYVHMDAPLIAPENLLPDAYASTSKGGKKAIEFYGESKIRRRQQVDTLHHCTLREASISKAGDLETLSEAVAAFVHVDLKGNLLSDWQEIGLIASQMPLLEILSVGSNRMKPPTGVPSSLTGGACDHLRVLEIGSCGIRSWSQVAMLGEWAPSLEELCAADNNVSDVTDVTSANSNNGEGGKVGGFRRLRSLDLSETALTSWEQVACFSHLPALTSLLLNHNRLTDVDEMSTPSTTSTSASTSTSTSEACYGINDSWPAPPPFPSLEAISLSGNRVGEWGAVDRLGSLPALRSLRFSGNPVTSGLGASEARAACIARLSKLDRVNGSGVSSRERTDAEKLYLRGLVQELDKLSAGEGNAGLSKEEAEKSIAERHPRYHDLWGLHGESMAFAGRGGGGAGRGASGSMASGMVEVTITSLVAASCTIAPVKKRLPSESVTVGKLKQLCKRLFMVDTDQQILSYRPEPGALLSTLDDDQKTLAYFGVGEGSEVLVSEVDEKQHARERERARLDDEGRLAEQLRHAEALGAVKRGQVASDTASAQIAAGK